jgi:sucrose-phosphate synthase
MPPLIGKRSSNGGITAIQDSTGHYIALISLHGLIRGERLELGRDADTGGQVLYVVDLAKALAAHPSVARVDLLTRQIFDARIDPSYSEPLEQIADKAYIVRIPFGPRRYLRKESLWPLIEVFVDQAPNHFRKVGRIPDVIHGHYADAGLAGSILANLLGVPCLFTGHSLGREKRRRLAESGMSAETMESRYSLSRRIEAEERALARAAAVIASTNQERDTQYAAYANFDRRRVHVMPPGVDLTRFRPPRRGDPEPPVKRRVERFLRRPARPWILALSRADPRKNLPGLLKAYGEHPHLRDMANLVIAVGHREKIRELDREKRQVLTELLLLIDEYDLYGHVAYPKQQVPEDVPAYYRLASETGGVFVNPALTEPFGLTLLEAAASGLPVVATEDGGPRDILATCKNGLLVDPLDTGALGAALFDSLSDRARWRSWAANGVRLSARHYTWEGHVKSYMAIVDKVRERPAKRRTTAARSRLPSVDRMLICDIDNTLIGDRQALAELVDRLEAGAGGIAFGIATGRRLESARQVLKESGAPPMDVYVTAVGTEIHYGPHCAEDTGWKQHLDYRWNRDEVYAVLKGLPGLAVQPASEQRPHKVSYYIDPGKAPPLEEIETMLRRRRICSNLVFSHGQYLDVLPVRASKGDALRYIAYKWGIPMERVLAAGDSGNDAGMLAGDSLGVVVGNYSEELERFRDLPRVYFAAGHHAWGVLEGIDYYDFFGDIRFADED